MPSFPPVTSDAATAMPFPLLEFSAEIPCSSVPETAPVAVTDRSPLPLLVALIPNFLPVTAATATVRFPPLLVSAVADIPFLVLPVTACVAVTDRSPLPLLFATIPDFSPVTVAAATVRLPALLWLAVADIPASAVPVTTPVAVTDRLPLPLLVAMIPYV